jgi:hypothetical protein
MGIFAFFMEPEASLSCLQEPVNSSSSNLRDPLIFILKKCNTKDVSYIRSNTVFPIIVMCAECCAHLC